MNKLEQRNLVESTQRLFEDRLIQTTELFQCEPRLKEAMTYSLLGGGKRFRPLLVLASAQLAGLSVEAVLPMAMALEMIHTYSLIHDDLPAMDDDDLRRGRPTSHKVFGEALAILAGDALLNEAMLLLMNTYGGTSSGTLAMAAIAKASGKDGMVGGQVLDMQSENQDIDLETLELMHRGKTGALIEVALTAPFYLADRPIAMIEQMAEIGKDLGVMFQIQDDILDVESDALTMGKTVGKDARDHKATYVSLLGLNQSRTLTSVIYTRIQSQVSKMGQNGTLLRSLTEAIIKRNH
ncbi:MAG: polyprenyl synthetase family protein [Clostridiaceae bacterium]